MDHFCDFVSFLETFIVIASFAWKRATGTLLKIPQMSERHSGSKWHEG